MNVRKIVKTTRKATFGVFELLILYVIAGTFSSFIAVNQDAEQKDDVSIYIFSNGMHTDLVLPLKTEEIDWSKIVKFEQTAGKDTIADYIAFGWGDKGFYLNTPEWSDLKISTAFKAAFALSESAIHTTFYKEIFEGDNCIKINISNSNYKRLVNYISDSFDKDENGQFIHINTTANYGSNDAFYEAVGTYNLFYTCNTWANNGLKACLQKASLWALLDNGMFYHYRKK
jgi:uncharacterized protein (TIGR02117 family)